MLNHPFLKFLICSFVLGISSCTYYFGPNKLTRHFKSGIVTNPAVYDYSATNTATRYTRHDSIIEFYSVMPIPEKHEIVDRDFVRILLAKLAQGREIEQVNASMVKLKPWAGHGSTGIFHKSGDYDFSEISWCSLLYLFGDNPELLYPETQNHLVNVLIGNSGSKPNTIMPGTGRLFRPGFAGLIMDHVSMFSRVQSATTAKSSMLRRLLWMTLAAVPIMIVAVLATWALSGFLRVRDALGTWRCTVRDG